MLLIISFELRMILENVWRGFVGNILNIISSPNVFPNLRLPVRFHQSYELRLTAVSSNGLTINLISSACE